MALTREQSQTRYVRSLASMFFASALSNLAPKHRQTAPNHPTNRPPQIPRHHPPRPHTLHTHTSRAIFCAARQRTIPRHLELDVQCARSRREHTGVDWRSTGKHDTAPRRLQLDWMRSWLVLRSLRQRLTCVWTVDPELRISLYARAHVHALLRNTRARKYHNPVRRWFPESRYTFVAR